jgi:acyl carrier protein
MGNSMFAIRVKEVISETLKVDFDKINDTDDIIDDLGADSIDVLDLILALENEFKISISDADVINNRIVEDIISYIVRKIMMKMSKERI